MALTTIRNDGLAIGSQGFTESSKITLSAASHSVTGIPDGVREIHLLFSQMSTSDGGPGMNVRLGTSSGLVTSGYRVQYMWRYGTTASGRSDASTGFEIGNWGTSIDMDGKFSLYRHNGSDDLWFCHYTTHYYTAYNGILRGSGEIDLSAPCDRIALVCASAGTFDAGTMQVLYR